LISAAAEKAAQMIKDAAENGIIALELLKKQGLPDLILLDMIMPEMNGWQFANEFAAKYDHLCPIIVMTAAADAQQRAKDINASGWIEKPFDLNKLLLVIKQHLKATPEKLN
jgi:CheY-like chemotaxis protein